MHLDTLFILPTEKLAEQMRPHLRPGETACTPLAALCGSRFTHVINMAGYGFQKHSIYDEWMDNAVRTRLAPRGHIC